MIKQFLILFAILLWTSVHCRKVEAQRTDDYYAELFSERDNATERSLKGNVKSIKTIYSKVDRTTGYRSLDRSHTAHIEQFDEDGKLVAYARYEGKPVYFPMLPAELEYLKYEGDVIREVSDLARTRYKVYDEHGEFQESWYEEDGVAILDEMAELTYNSDDLLIDKKIFQMYSGVKELKEHSLYTYDNDEKLTEERISGGIINLNIPVNSTAETVIKYVYDDDGNQISMSIQSGGMMLGSQEIKNKYIDGELREVEIITGGRVKLFLLKDGCIIKKRITDSSHGNMYVNNQEYLYEYDNEGNWNALNIHISESSRHLSVPNQTQIFIKREITYY